MAGLVSTVLVLARGVAKELPAKYEASKAELAASRGMQLAEDADDAALDAADAQQDAMDDAQDDEKKEAGDEGEGGDAMETDDPFDMAHYDDEPDDAVMRQALSNVALGRDPYLHGNATNAEEMDDVVITRDDLVLLAAVSEDDELSHLDVYVYDRAQDNLYVHHDYMLPAFPLSLAWLDFPVGSARPDEQRKENLVAISTFEPYIEIWDLDTYDQPAPLAVLGGPEDHKDFGKKLTKKLLRSDSHTDAVLGLAWNSAQRNLLASASADGSVKLWDLCTGSCLRTLRHHGGAKVQSVQWNPQEPALLATGAYDKRVAVLDVRAPDTAVAFARVDTDVEALLWRPAPNHAQLLVATESGSVHCYDVRQGLDTPRWSLRAHQGKPAHALAISRAWNGSLLATGSDERSAPVKLWFLRDDAAPQLVWEGGAELGPVFSLSFSPDEPLVLIAGVQGERPAVIDLERVEVVAQRHKQWTEQFGGAANNDAAAPAAAAMAPGALTSAISAVAPSSPSTSSSSNNNNNSNSNGKKQQKKGKGKSKGR